VLFLDDCGELGELKGSGVKLPSRCSIASLPGLLEQQPCLSPCRFESSTAISRPILLA
jgi:hypothetical protein